MKLAIIKSLSWLVMSNGFMKSNWKKKLYEFGNRKCVCVEKMTANGKWTENCMEMSVCTVAAAFKWADFPKEALVTGM